MTDNFYLVMTSDASLSQYPENNAADFTTQLPSQLHLSEDWEVVMTSIIYLYIWQNVSRESVVLHFVLTSSEP